MAAAWRSASAHARIRSGLIVPITGWIMAGWRISQPSTIASRLVFFCDAIRATRSAVARVEVKAPQAPMGLSCGARAGLTSACKALSQQVAWANVTINNLLPERIDTPRQKFMAERMIKQQGITMEEARRRIAESIAAKRFGRPEEFADACAYLCSAQAGFISGQNLQLDGGSYHGLI